MMPMLRSRLVILATVIGHVYLPVVRCVYPEDATSPVFALSASSLLVELSALAVLLATLGWLSTWVRCAIYSVSMTCSTVALYWLTERWRLVYTNQGVDRQTWLFYLAVLLPFFGLFLVLGRSGRSAYMLWSRRIVKDGQHRRRR